MNSGGGTVNTHPVLPDTFVEFAPAYAGNAPDVEIVESLTDTKSTEMRLPSFRIVAGVPAVVETIDMSLPEVPLTLKVVTVVVVLMVSARVRALVTSEKLRVLNVFEPVIVSWPVEPATV